MRAEFVAFHGACSAQERAVYAARIVRAHLRYVVCLAQRYCPISDPRFLDFVQEGALGLWAAMGSYCALEGASFLTYATWRIQGALAHAYYTLNLDAVRYGRNFYRAQRRLARLSERHQTLGLSRSPEELSELLRNELSVRPLSRNPLSAEQRARVVGRLGQRDVSLSRPT